MEASVYRWRFPTSLSRSHLDGLPGSKYRNCQRHVAVVTAPSGNGVNAVRESSTRDSALAFELELEGWHLPLGSGH